MKNIYCLVVVFILLFLYIFNILPIFGPEKVGTREYLSILASLFVLLILDKLPKVYFWIVLANWTQVLFSIMTVIANGTTDFWYVQFAIRNVLYINGALLIAYVMPKKWSIDILLVLFVVAVVLNDLISLAGFLNSGVASFILSIQDFAKMEKIENTIEFGNRIVGIGRNNFFNGGVINGMGLILVFYLMTQKRLPQFLGMVFVFIMTVVGMFIARTTIVGLGLGGLLYLLSLKNKTKMLKGIFSIAIIVIVVIAFGFFEGINTSHAFELFEHYDNLEEVESLNKMGTMYNRQMGVETFLFGDGLSKEGDSYYMRTDVGYLRNIFYFGIIGTVFGYFYYEYYILKQLYLQNVESKLFVLTIAAYLLALNIKGLPDFNFFVFLMLAYYIRRKQINTGSRLRLKTIKNNEFECLEKSNNRQKT